MREQMNEKGGSSIGGIGISNITHYLLQFPSVIDSFIYKLDNGTGNYCIYIVPQNISEALKIQTDGSLLLKNEIDTYLKTKFPSIEKDKYYYIFVKNIPYNIEGNVDIERLLTLPALDEKDISKIEEAIKKHNKLDSVAIIAEEVKAPTQNYHISDLISQWGMFEQTGSDNKFSKDSTKINISDKASQVTKPAISDGGELIIPQNSPQTLQEVIFETAENAGDKGVHFIEYTKEEVFISYKQLLEKSKCILTGLREKGVKPGNKVIFQFVFNKDFCAAFWACVLGGFVPVPIGPAPTYESDHANVLKLVNAWEMMDQAVVLSNEEIVDDIKNIESRFTVPNFAVIAIEELYDKSPATDFHVSDSEDLALLMLTSGSTGKPKGVMLNHNNLIHRTLGSIQLNTFTKDDVTFNWMAMDHVGGIIYFHIRDVFLGAKQIHAASDVILQDPLMWLDVIDHHRVTLTWAPNFAYALVNDRESELKNKKWDLSCVNYFLSGAEAVVANTSRTFVHLLTPFGMKKNVLHPVYGMSETSSGITYSYIFKLEPDEGEEKFVSVGVPIPGDVLRICNENDRVINEGEEGRLQVSGATVTTGYYNDPENTEEAFTEDGWLITGDLGMIIEGNLYITGREKDVIVINGVNYYSHEIESVIEELDDVVVSYTAACSIRDPKEDTDLLVIFFNTEITEEAPLLELIKTIRKQVFQKNGVNADFILPVLKEDIPKTEIGKIQRPKLVNQLEQGKFFNVVKHMDLLNENENTIPYWFYAPTWQKKNIHITKTLREPVVVIGDMAGIFEGLKQSTDIVEVALYKNFEKRSPQKYYIDLDDPYRYEKLCKEIDVLFNSSQLNEPIEIIHFLNYNEPLTTIVANEILDYQKKYIYDVVTLTQALNHFFKERLINVLIVANNIFSEETVAFEKAPLIGLTQTINEEYSTLNCTLVSCNSSSLDESIQLIINELCSVNNDTLVSYNGSERLVPGLIPVNLSEYHTGDDSKFPGLVHGGFFIISGGLGGIGKAIAKYLLSNIHANILLLGRTDINDFSDLKKQEFDSLKTFPGRVQYESCDISNEDDVRNAVQKAMALMDADEIDGIFHLAGLVDEVLLIEEKADHFTEILRPKIMGTIALHNLAKNYDGALFVNFSSVNSFFGGTSVGAYSAANSFLDSFSSFQRNSSTLQVYNVRWSMWDSVGMSSHYSLAAKLLSQKKGFIPIGLDEGMTSLFAIVGTSFYDCFVGIHNNKLNISRYINSNNPQLINLNAYYENSDQHDAPSLEMPEYRDVIGKPVFCTFDALTQIPRNSQNEIDKLKLFEFIENFSTSADDYKPPRNELEETLVSLWSEILHKRNIGISHNFFELGGNSLLATKLVSRVRDICNLDLTFKDLFNATTIEDLAEIIADKQSGDGQISSMGDIEIVDRNANLSLSFAQQRLWFLDKMEPGQATYNTPISISIKGDIDMERLKNSFLEIITRHETLRTTFAEREGNPCQVIKDVQSISIDEIFSVIDFSSYSNEEKYGKLEVLSTEESRKPFNLEHGPLMRIIAVVLSSTESTVIINMHHIITDGWSVTNFIHELGIVYNSKKHNTVHDLPAIDIHYADFSMWQREWLTGDIKETQLSYWKSKLANAPQLELPIDKTRPSIQTFNGVHAYYDVPNELISQLRKITEESKATLFMTLLAIFYIQLYKYTSDEDICVGTPIANRTRSEVEGLIGFFVNTLVIRTQLNGSVSFNDLLSQVKEETLSAYSHQDIPFEILVEELVKERNLSQSPLFQVMFILQNSLQDELTIPGLTCKTDFLETYTSKFDLTMEMRESKDSITCIIEYNSDLFEQQTIDQFMKHYLVLAEEIVKNPKAQIAQLEMLTKKEYEQIVFHWNDTKRENGFEEMMHNVFEKKAEAIPDQEALVFEDISLTYKEFNEQANILAHHLRSLGVDKEMFVGVYTERSIEMVVALHGIVKAGGAYVPLDPTYPKDRLEYMVEDANVSVLLTQSHLIDSLPETNATVIALDTEFESFDQSKIENPEVELTPDTMAYMIYTSGTTGRPKGVVNVHKAISNRLIWMQDYFNIGETDRVIQKTPFSFDVSVWEFFWPFMYGSTLVIAKPEGHKDPGYLIDLINNENITTIHFVPSMLKAFIEDENASTCKGLERVICSGEALTKDLHKRFASQLSCGLYNLYGPTEAAVDVTYYACDREDESEIVPIGKPIDNTEIYILDKDLNPTPVGVPGELHIGGVQLARCYWNREELTAEKFIPTPFKTDLGDRLYKTGDLTKFRSDGTIDYLDRIDFQVKIRGLRIELGEIESVLEEHPKVKQVAVIVHEDAGKQKMIVSYVVLHEAIDSKDLKVYLGERLPDYMVPSLIIPIDTIPLSPNGKLDRRSLPSPEKYLDGQSSEYVAPGSSTEENIVLLWQKLLNKDRIGIYDNFFEIGGNSLLIIKLHNELKKVFDGSFSVIDLFKNPTVKLFADFLEGSTASKEEKSQEIKDRTEKRKAAAEKRAKRKR